MTFFLRESTFDIKSGLFLELLQNVKEVHKRNLEVNRMIRNNISPSRFEFHPELSGAEPWHASRLVNSWRLSVALTGRPVSPTPGDPGSPLGPRFPCRATGVPRSAGSTGHTSHGSPCRSNEIQMLDNVTITKLFPNRFSTGIEVIFHTES